MESFNVSVPNGKGAFLLDILKQYDFIQVTPKKDLSSIIEEGNKDIEEGNTLRLSTPNDIKDFLGL